MKPWFLLVCLAALQGCALTVSDPRALKPLASFAPMASDARVWVEPGFEEYGERVAAALPEAKAQVEAAHYLPFAKTIRVNVCGTSECFRRYVLTPRLSAAVIPDNRLILSPNLNERERHRLPSLLAHELAHLHLGQRIGHYHSALPVWFHEGWASLAANGGGADYATDAQAFAAIGDGRRVNLLVRDTYDRRHRASASRLSIHEFYRQSMLLVGWLRDHDEERFRALVLAIQNNEDFDIAFWNVYGKAPATHLAEFFNSTQNKLATDDSEQTQAAPAQPPTLNP